MKNQRIFKERWEVEPKLADLGLKKEDLVRVVEEAFLARNNTTVNDPANAAGWFSYSYGTRALRDNFCPQGWLLDRKDSIESIFNPKANIKIVYQNVDCASDDSRLPKARTPKGAGSERAVENNERQFKLDLNLEDYYEVEENSGDNTQTWYLCVSLNGDDVRAELSLPKSFEDGKFSDFLVRLFIIKQGDWDGFPFSDEDEEDDQDYEVKVVRK